VGQARLTVTVRRLAAADLGQVGAIFAWYAASSAVTFEDGPRSEEEWLDLAASLSSLGLPFLVAETDREVTGYAYAGPWRHKPAYRHTVEDSIFVAPGRTGHGIGRLLLTALIAASAAAGARQMIAVIADTGDEASARLHAACGFEPVGVLTAVGYKHGRWIDTLLMQRSLG
jgi:L-amino acid N-acyltransferase YncA